MLIALMGKMTSGKTEFAKAICEKQEWGFEKIAFGDAVKEHAIKAGLLTKEESDKKTSYARFIWQHMATDLIRDQIDQDYWIKCMDKYLSQFDLKQRNFIIDDLRFFNEYNYVKSKNGFILKIVRPDIKATDDELSHRSEAEQDKMNCNFFFENDEGIDKLHSVANSFFDFIKHMNPYKGKYK